MSDDLTLTDPPAEPAWPPLNTVFLGGLFMIALLAVCYVAAPIILPIILAVILKLVLQPLMRLLDRIGLSRLLAAFCAIAALVLLFTGMGMLLSDPATQWAEKLPSGMSRVQEEMTNFSAPLTSIRKAIHRAEVTSLAADSKTITVAVKGTTLTDRVLAGMTQFVSGLFETLLVLFFMLISGDTFLRRLVEILPRFRDKKQVVEISQQVECDISGYLLTITAMNLGVGIATSLIMWGCGVEDPLLWGTVAFLLNFVPLLGPIIAAGLFAFVSIISLPDSDLGFLLPTGLYLLVHMIEGQLVTPMLLARRFTLNPVLVVLALVFWYWMWGVPGAILATPMLAIAKIICDRVERLKPLGHFMEGQTVTASVPA